MKPNPPVRIVESKLGQQGSSRAVPIVVPFGVNQDETELVLVLLDRARAAGAAWVGDLDAVVTFRWNGTPVECHARVLFDGDPELAAAARSPAGEPPAYGTNLDEFRPRRLDVTADETAMLCKEGTVSHLDKTKRSVDARFDVTEHRPYYGVPPRQNYDTEIVSEGVDRCEKQRVHRHAQRYDYEVKLGLVPPDWTYLSRRYADGNLVTAPPVCFRIAEVREPVYRLTATAFFRAKAVEHQAQSAPSDAMLENMNIRENVSLEAARQRCLEVGRKPSECAGLELGESGWFKQEKNAWKEHQGGMFEKEEQ